MMQRKFIGFSRVSIQFDLSDCYMLGLASERVQWLLYSMGNESAEEML